MDSRKRKGYFGSTACYVGDKANKEYANANANAVATLDLPMPVFYIETLKDSVCETMTSRLADPQRRHCMNLTETSLDAGHWAHLEKP